MYGIVVEGDVHPPGVQKKDHQDPEQEEPALLLFPVCTRCIALVHTVVPVHRNRSVGQRQPPADPAELEQQKEQQDQKAGSFSRGADPAHVDA